MDHTRRSFVYAGLSLVAGSQSMAAAAATLGPRRAAANVEFSVVHDMDATAPDIAGRLVLAPDGHFYAAAPYGGRHDDGLIFRIAPDGSGFAVQYEFADSPGVRPSGLTIGADGMLYGVTHFDHGVGNGFVYRMTLNGALTVLQGPMPWEPTGELLQARDGRWYGVAVGPDIGVPGRVYRMPADCSQQTVLHEFSVSEGMYPGGLIEARNGLIYGTASRGGTKDKGTVFSLSPDGQLTVLHSFEGDGRYPGGLVLGPAGLLYGSTAWTKPKNNYPHGTLFSLNRKSGQLTTLFDFPNAREDGTFPMELVRGLDGFYYGSTYGGGRSSEGTLLRMTPEGAVETLFRFNGKSDGGWPYCPLTEVADGEFYGVTLVGGASGRGTIFRLKVTA